MVAENPGALGGCTRRRSRLAHRSVLSMRAQAPPMQRRAAQSPRAGRPRITRRKTRLNIPCVSLRAVAPACDSIISKIVLACLSVIFYDIPSHRNTSTANSQPENPHENRNHSEARRRRRRHVHERADPGQCRLSLRRQGPWPPRGPDAGRGPAGRVGADLSEPVRRAFW